MEFAHGVGAIQRRVGATLERVNALVKTLEPQLYVVGVAGIETQKGREDLYDTALPLLKEAVKLSESKEAAQNALARLLALRILGHLIQTRLAIKDSIDSRPATVAASDSTRTRRDPRGFSDWSPQPEQPTPCRHQNTPHGRCY